MTPRASSLTATCALAALMGSGLAPAAAAAPAAGSYESQLCVTLAAQAPACGPAQVRLAGARVQVQVSDIVYRLQLKSSQADVALMHGSMQIDEFTASYEWVGPVLQFADAAKQTHYEVQLGERLRAPR